LAHPGNGSDCAATARELLALAEAAASTDAAYPAGRALG